LRGADRLISILSIFGITPLIITKNAFGAKFILDPKNYIDKIVLQSGYYESEVLQCILSQIKSNEVFWDIGANIGLHSITAKYIDNSISVFAFEPYPNNTKNLITNASLNKLAINVMSIALFSDCRIHKMKYIEGNSGMATLTPWSEANYDYEINIYSNTIDDLIFKQHFPAPNVIKIDTEGSELFILQGAKFFLSQCNRISIIFEAANNFMDIKSDLKEELDKYNFQYSQLKRIENTGHGLSNFLAFKN
jgi:FkbM family methyltransferase